MRRVAYNILLTWHWQLRHVGVKPVLFARNARHKNSFIIHALSNYQWIIRSSFPILTLLPHLVYVSTASELIWEWGRERRGPKGRERGGGWSSWAGTASPSPPARGFAGACKLPQQGPGRSPGRRRVSCILCRQIAFHSISVRVAYS